MEQNTIFLLVIILILIWWIISHNKAPMAPYWGTPAAQMNMPWWYTMPPTPYYANKYPSAEMHANYPYAVMPPPGEQRFSLTKIPGHRIDESADYAGRFYRPDCGDPYAFINSRKDTDIIYKDRDCIW